VFSGRVEEQLRLRSGMPNLPIAALADKDRIDRDLCSSRRGSRITSRRLIGAGY
jgi:hypothetical protein